MNFAAFRLGGVQIRPVAELPGAQVLGDFTNTVFDVLPAQVNWMAVGAHSSQRDVDMGMFGIEMVDGNPFQRCADIVLSLVHQFARQAGKVNSLAEFRRDNDLPQALVSGSLPRFEPGRNINSLVRMVKPDV